MENDRTEQKAPKNKFRVIGVDTFSNEDWSYGDFKTKEEAIKVAKEKGGTMNKVHVYDDKGKHLFEAGTF
jgi:hypothetical protein